MSEPEAKALTAAEMEFGGCAVGDSTCGGWPSGCPEPMRCAVDHLFSALDLNAGQSVVVRQHPYTAEPGNG